MGALNCLCEHENTCVVFRSAEQRQIVHIAPASSLRRSDEAWCVLDHGVLLFSWYVLLRKQLQHPPTDSVPSVPHGFDSLAFETLGLRVEPRVLAH